MLGTKYINIKSGKSTTPVGPDQELPSVNTGEIQDLVQQGFGVLNSLQDTVQRVDKIVGLVEAGKGSIGKLLVDETLYNHLLADPVDEVKQLADTLNSDKGTFGIADLRSRAVRPIPRYCWAASTICCNNSRTGKGPRASFSKIRRSIIEARAIPSAGCKTLVDNLNAGKGTAGQLLTSEDLSNQLKATICQDRYGDR